MDTAAILAKMGPGVPEPIVIDPKAYGPWFRLMVHETTQTDKLLGGRDIGSLNLEAALGLPGAENLNLDACVQKLNAWAKQVRAFTQDHWHLFQRSPEDYDHSRGHFLMLALVTFLQKHLDVHYNLAFNEGDYDASDSRNLFLHGILSGHGGTCATLPVLYLAIGRRLGYPLHLVRAREHLFARWEEPGGERFNVECTSPGFRPRDDEYYHHRPKPLTEEEICTGTFLRNLRPREALAEFLCMRAQCLLDHLRPGEAVLASFLARQLAMKEPGVRGNWFFTTVMAHALEEARRKAGLEGYLGLDLRRVPVPKGKAWFERWAAPLVRQSLQRLDRMHRKNDVLAHSRLIGALHRADGKRFPHTTL